MGRWPRAETVALWDSGCFSHWGRHRSPFRTAEIISNVGATEVWRTLVSFLLPTVETLIDLLLVLDIQSIQKINKNKQKLSYLLLVFCILDKNTVCHHQVKILDFFCPTPSNWKFYLYNISGISPCGSHHLFVWPYFKLWSLWTWPLLVDAMHLFASGLLS